jgi:hypothetical protein
MGFGLIMDIKKKEDFKYSILIEKRNHYNADDDGDNLMLR